MKTIHVINPCAGHGKAYKKLEEMRKNGLTDEIYVTESGADASAYIAKRTEEEDNVHFQVYGGDGTVFDAVNGIMSAKTRRNVSFGVTPSGSGNDFVRSFDGKEPKKIDLISFNGKYAANMLNIGFDCSVVVRTGKYKKNPLVSGSMAYILGVVSELIRKKPLITSVELVLEDGTVERMDNHAFLLIAIANGRFCGGGFEGASAAKPDDGLLDVLLVNDLSRMEFIKLVGDYRKGTHVDRETGKVAPKFEGKLLYRKCRTVKLDRVCCICADGELFYDSTLTAEVIPTPLTYAPSLDCLPEDILAEMSAPV